MGDKKLKPVRGAKVRLKYDITTRGNRKFRKGLVMTILSDSGCFFLGVWVRTKHFHLQLKKKDYPAYFEVIAEPPKADEEEPDDGNHPGQGDVGGGGDCEP